MSLPLSALLLAATALATSSACGPAVAATPASAVADCDRLAAYPDDPFRVGPGVANADMDRDAALAACERAIAEAPTNARVRYQYARVLFYTGRAEPAIREMRAAADAGYAQAQFVYGTFIARGREGAPRDPCLVERYWKLSAAGGRQAARVQYVRFALRGRFAGCADLASPEAQAGMLATASAQAKDFYERLLIEDLTEALGAARAGGR